MAFDMNREGDEFLHIKGDSNFQQRSSAVFSCLDNLEPDHDTKNESKGERSRRCRIPDHIVHPERWGKYSLEDVKEAIGGLSGDALNRHVALSFIDDLKKRKAEKEEDTTNTAQLQNEVFDKEMKEKIVFSKDVIKHKMEVDEVASPTAQGSARVISECAVGQTPSTRSSKSKRTAKIKMASPHASGAVVDLSHLKEAEKECDVDNSKSGSLETVEEERQSEAPLFPKRKFRGSHKSHNLRKREEKKTNVMN